MNDLIKILELMSTLSGQPAQTQYHVNPAVVNPQTCGSYETRLDYGDRWVYQRWDGCVGSLIGERWEKKSR